METTTDALSTVLDLALTRTIVTRDVDAALGAHGLALSDLALLLELRDAPDGRLRRVELANRLGVTPSGVARQLQPLERIGLVGREPHSRDARLALVVLTDTGRRVADESVPTAEAAAERALARMWPAAERERLARLMAAVR
jgi:DNA-binding MarR family transcriptional regulator